ncbi:MAG: oligosaccharide flippase family protein [Pseudomonadales bacterium]|nr:oligosaccharide flippase family protein [Pseudomonadales bacterium]
MSYALIGVKLVVTLFMTPILVSSLGQEGYGLFVIVGAAAAYLYILDFGINDSVLRFFVAHEDDHEARDGFLARMLALYTGLGGMVILVTLGMVGLAQPIFGRSLALDQIVVLETMILITGVGAAVLVAFNPLSALLSATERFVFLRSLEIGASVISALVTVVLLKIGYGMVMVVSVMTASMIVQVVVRLAYTLTRMRVRVRFQLPSIPELHVVTGYAAPIFLSMIAEAIFWKLDNILIGALIGTAPVAIYAIGVTFNKYLMSFSTAISRIMTPEIIRQVDAGADAVMLTGLMVRISRVQALALSLILGGLIVFGQRFLTLWLGPDFALSYYVMLAVLCPYTLELMGNARNIILQVKGLYWHKSMITFAMAAINIPLTIVLLNTFGVIGAAASTGIMVLVNYFLIAILLKRRVGLEMGLYWRETSRGILPIIAALVFAGLLGERFLPGGWLAFIGGVLVFTIVYILAMTKFAASAYERALLRQLLARLSLFSKGHKHTG